MNTSVLDLFANFVVDDTDDRDLFFPLKIQCDTRLRILQARLQEFILFEKHIYSKITQINSSLYALSCFERGNC